jgi:hypothetical protein
MPGMPGMGGPGAAGRPGGPGGGGPVAAAAKAPDFRDPMKGAQSFLDAVKSKDAERISEAIAQRSRNEAVDSHKERLAALLDKSADQATLDELADLFEGMRITDTNVAKSTGRRGVILSKRKGNDEIRITLYMRRELNDWKVVDYSGKKINKGFNPLRAKR